MLPHRARPPRAAGLPLILMQRRQLVPQLQRKRENPNLPDEVPALTGGEGERRPGKGSAEFLIICWRQTLLPGGDRVGASGPSPRRPGCQQESPSLETVGGGGAGGISCPFSVLSFWSVRRKSRHSIGFLWRRLGAGDGREGVCHGARVYRVAVLEAGRLETPTRPVCVHMGVF